MHLSASLASAPRFFRSWKLAVAVSLAVRLDVVLCHPDTLIVWDGQGGQGNNIYTMKCNGDYDMKIFCIYYFCFVVIINLDV